MSQTRWAPVIETAREFVLAQPIPPDLRDTHYHLAGRQLVSNTVRAYKTLSELTAPMRRKGTFPDFHEDVRRIARPFQFDGADDCAQWSVDNFRIDHTIGQDVSIHLVVEKNGMVPRLRHWFDHYALPVTGLRGFASATIEKKINRDIAHYDRPAICLYMGDFDPSGILIPDDFALHTHFAKVVRLGVNEDQVERHGLLESIAPQSLAKKADGSWKDSRVPEFVRRFGRVRQVEMNAMPFDLVRELYTDAIAEFWDTSRYEATLAREREEREDLAARLGIELTDGLS